MMTDNPSSPRLHRKIWGRKQARPLAIAQRELLAHHLPHFQYHLPSYGTLAPVRPDALFMESYSSYALEIGFGGGEHLYFRAQEAPNTGFIGCDPFLTGVPSLLKQVTDQKMDNIRLVIDDARLLLQALEPECLSKIYILFPDPWPKARHHKRRIIHTETIGLISRALKCGGQLTLATDIAEYAQWMRDILHSRSEFQLHMGHGPHFHKRPADWYTTRYERKGINAGRQPQYMIYDKISSTS